MLEKEEPKYFYCYATANDRKHYLRDIRNLIRLKNAVPGVNEVFLYIAISKMKRLNLLDKLFAGTIKNLFVSHQYFELKEIFFKENKGRDFSSYASLIRKLLPEATENDYVFFQNRSAYGPFENGYFNRFINQFNRFDNVALCGSTINFANRDQQKFSLPHVQTYTFFTRLKYLKMILKDFPGEHETEREKIIHEGEIGLSQFFLERNFGITCLEWPSSLVKKDSPPLASDDIKEYVTAQHPYYHRQYFRRHKKERKKNRVLQPLGIFLFAFFKSH